MLNNLYQNRTIENQSRNQFTYGFFSSFFLFFSSSFFLPFLSVRFSNPKLLFSIAFSFSHILVIFRYFALVLVKMLNKLFWVLTSFILFLLFFSCLPVKKDLWQHIITVISNLSSSFLFLFTRVINAESRVYGLSPRKMKIPNWVVLHWEHCKQSERVQAKATKKTMNTRI